MKLCPNCKRLSRDDDFCSYCGSAVYDDNTEYSIDCSQIPGHTHEKQTFSGMDVYRTSRNDASVRPEHSQNGKKKKNGLATLIVVIVLVKVLADILFGGLGAMFDLLERFLNEL